MIIYIVRHAYAYEHGDPRWPDDSKRPLAPEGAERFQQVVELLANRGFEPEVIATSPYIRCRQTADVIAAHTPGKPKVIELPALTPGSDFDELVEWTQAQAAESIAWVGHSPDVNHLAAALIGDGDTNIRFAKGAIAAIRMHGQFEPACGELQWHVTAKSLGV